MVKQIFDEAVKIQLPSQNLHTLFSLDLHQKEEHFIDRTCRRGTNKTATPRFPFLIFLFGACYVGQQQQQHLQQQQHRWQQ